MGRFGDHIKITITAPAIENQANEFLQKWLAKQLKVTQAQVILEKGQHSRFKTFRICEPRQIPVWLKEIIK